MWQAIIVVTFFIAVGLLSGAMKLMAAVAVMALSAFILTLKWREITAKKRIRNKLKLDHLRGF